MCPFARVSSFGAKLKLGRHNRRTLCGFAKNQPWRQQNCFWLDGNTYCYISRAGKEGDEPGAILHHTISDSAPDRAGLIMRTVSNTAGTKNISDPSTHMMTAPSTWSASRSTWNGLGPLT